MRPIYKKGVHDELTDISTITWGYLEFIMPPSVVPSDKLGAPVPII